MILESSLSYYPMMIGVDNSELSIYKIPMDPCFIVAAPVVENDIPSFIVMSTYVCISILYNCSWYDSSSCVCLCIFKYKYYIADPYDTPNDPKLSISAYIRVENKIDKFNLVTVLLYNYTFLQTNISI